MSFLDDLAGISLEDTEKGLFFSNTVLFRGGRGGIDDSLRTMGQSVVVSVERTAGALGASAAAYHI